MHRRRTTGPPTPRGLATGPGKEADAGLPRDALQWSWPPYAPVEMDHESFDTPEWAPASEVWHPQVRVGRWTVVYRRAA